MKTLKSRYLLGAATVLIGLPVFGQVASADDTLNRVMERLEKLEKENAKLRAKVNKLEDGSAGPAATKGDTGYKAPAGSAAAQPLTKPAIEVSPAAYAAPPIASDDGWYIHKKAGPGLTFQTPGGEVTAYGNFDVSFDGITKGLRGFVNNNPLSANGGAGDSPIGDMGWLADISSNLSYVGIRGFQKMTEWDGKPIRFVYQLETLIEVSAFSGTRETGSNQSNVVQGGLTSRNSYIGISQADYGALKIGKTEAPYKTSTDSFNPFSAMIGDYRVVMGNTGGDNRVEFATRLEHAIWYESPIWQGFQVSALYSPGQNRSNVDDNIASGSPDCTGGNIPGSGNPTGNTLSPPVMVGTVACTDGSFGDAFSISGTYVRDGLTVVAAYEVHQKVNRSSDLFGLSGGAQAAATATGLTNAQLASLDIADEDAWKVGVQYKFHTNTTVSAIYENMTRYVPQVLAFQNERSRDGTWLAISQDLTDKDNISAGWAHAFATPGDPGQHNSAGGADPKDAADMITGAYRHKFTPALTWYTTGAATINQRDAHYDLGAGGHGVTTDGHDAFSQSGDPLFSSPHTWTGGTLIGVSTGLNYKF